jgi:putative transposase
MSDSTKKGSKHHTAEQVIAKLREATAMLASGQSLAQVIQSLGVSEATYHRWKDQYGGMRSGEAKRLKDLEQEHVRLKVAARVTVSARRILFRLASSYPHQTLWHRLIQRLVPG